MSDVIIKVENLSKTFKLYNHPKDRLKEALSPFGKIYHHEYHALKDISFEIKKGDSLGILGKNGAGKSTLLKILTGVLTPTSGKVTVNGRIAALLELGSGFNPELSGLENIYFQGAIMGFTKEEMETKISGIVEFADIGEFINQPVKTYSSGMFARLAFSIAINVDPDILIVDEALSVGDALFQAKCMLKMREMINVKKVTLLFVSHSVFAVRHLCTSALLLGGGQLIKSGPTAEVTELYFSINVKSSQANVVEELMHLEPESTGLKKMSPYGRLGNGHGKFIDVSLLGEDNQHLHSVSFKQKVNLQFKLNFRNDIDCLGYGFHIRNQDGVDVLYFATGAEVDFLRDVKANSTIVINNEFELSLIQGNYTIALVMAKPIDLENGIAEFVDFIPLAYHFEMQKRMPTEIYGLVGLENKSSILSRTP